jgi:uncharacterized lipoprotein YehR (DUF1307 family)
MDKRDGYDTHLKELVAIRGEQIDFKQLLQRYGVVIDKI